MQLSFLLLTFALLLQASWALNAAHRYRRDLTCATGGHRLCSFYCKGKGLKDGSCAWDTETGSYDCECDREKRGIRCNLGGPNTCHYSCVVLGYREGHCEEATLKCNCGGGHNRWGNALQSVKDRL